MVSVLNYIGRLYWLAALTLFFGAIGVIANSVEAIDSEGTNKPFYVKNQAHKTLRINSNTNVALIDRPYLKSLARENSIVPAKPISETSFITAVLGAADDLSKRQKPYWPYREGIDCAVMKCIALTFDDGPSPNTPALLDILSAKKAVATFFVTGYNAGPNTHILRRMVYEKNEIGNHGYGHKNYRKLPPPEVTNEVNRVQDLVFNSTGYKPHILRPPYGEFRPGDSVLSSMPIIFWNNDPDDWKHRNPIIVDNNVLATVRPGSIVVMHDLYPTSVSAIPPLIDNLQNQGYTLVTITELFGWKDPATPLPNGQLLRGR